MWKAPPAFTTWLLALNLYHKLLFGQFHQGNPEIVRVAGQMERTAGSLASLDPAERARGIVGLGNTSTMDRLTWK